MADGDVCEGRKVETMTSTVYYSPTMTTETVNCPAVKKCRAWTRTGKKKGKKKGRGKRVCANWSSTPSQVLNVIIGRNGEKVRGCDSIRAALKMQGSATVFEKIDSSGRASRAVAIYKVDEKGVITKEKLDDRLKACPAGIGRGNICLNPFKFVAAPPGFRTGDVIHVPSTLGMRYPEYPGQPRGEWARHDGNWIVGDSGSAIQSTKKNGVGRFDFYAGLMHWRDSNNPLMELGLGKSSTKKYCRLSDAAAAEVRNGQDYPRFPARLKSAWLDGASGAQPVVASARPASVVAPARPVVRPIREAALVDLNNATFFDIGAAR